jgi:hypothetical protein
VSDTQIVAEIIKALTITGPVGVVLGFSLWKVWGAWADERTFSRDLHLKAIDVIAANTLAQQANSQAVERLEATVDELRRGISEHRQH